MNPKRNLTPSLVLAALALAIGGGCAAPAAAQATAPLAHPNSIQPETTLVINATGTVSVAPDMAMVTTGVQNEADTAVVAMAENRAAMNGVFEVLRAAGLEDRDIQTSNFSVNPVYDYVAREDGRGQRQVLRGYRASNQVSAKVTDLNALGAILDGLAEAGANTIQGIGFGLVDDTQVRDEARRQAMATAMSRAQLYAEAAGYEVARIVTISEFERGRPQPMMDMALSRAMESGAPTPVSGGEVGYSIDVNVTFELTQ